MQEYVEDRLTELHEVAVKNKFLDKFFAFVLASFLIVILPYLHIGVFYMKIWVPDKPKIDRYGCTCSCFDTVFRGRYENPGMVTYKHVYFNATSSTFQIWVFTTVFILLFYESLRYLVGLFRSGVPIRRSMLLLYVVNLYPHYYSWWSFFSYYNEELYTYFTHHFLFTITEMITTAIVLNLCNRDNSLSSWKVATIISINLVHIIVSGSDQFIAHVLQGEGHSFQNVRNLGLMIPDLFHVVVPCYLLYKHAREHRLNCLQLCYKEEVILMIFFISVGTILGRLT
ncbi:uncharacterized protein LOC112555793 isoform X2 [Pomacea canaliculata]|nr:uncharacterized protein LOC112555793 isoform X2 [Pomacea canaliculata]